MHCASLRLYASGSLRALIGDLTRAFAAVASTPLEARTAPSGLLAAEIPAGAPADVAISADRGYLEQLRAAGLVATVHIIAGKRMTMVARADTADTTRSVEDLARDGLRVTHYRAETDPCGAYTVEMVARAGLTDRLREKADRGEVLIAEGGGDLPGWITDGQANVGVVYASFASTFLSLA